MVWVEIMYFTHQTSVWKDISSNVCIFPVFFLTSLSYDITGWWLVSLEQNQDGAWSCELNAFLCTSDSVWLGLGRHLVHNMSALWIISLCHLFIFMTTFSFCKSNAFMQGLYCWCIQGHADIKNVNVGCSKSFKPPCWKVTQQSQRTSWHMKWNERGEFEFGCVWHWNGFYSGCQVNNLRCWSSLNVSTWISKQSPLGECIINTWW